MIVKLTDKGKEAKQRYDEYCSQILEAKEKGAEFFDHDSHDSNDDVVSTGVECFTPLGDFMEDLLQSEDNGDGTFEVEEEYCCSDLEQMKLEGYIE